MTKESPFEKWDRLSKHTRADLEKAARSTPQSRRRQNRLNVVTIVGIYLLSMIFNFIGHDYESRWRLVIDLMIPDPLAALAIAWFASAPVLAKKSKLSDDEARALADEAEEEQRKDREFAKWLWTGKKPNPDGKKPDSCEE